MAKVLLIILFLIGLTAVLKKVAKWFAENKDINIIPSTFIEMVAVIVFMFTYGSINTSEIIWMWISVAVVVIITILNLLIYGIKDGILASFAELAFSVSAAFLIACMLVASSQEKTRQKLNRRR